MEIIFLILQTKLQLKTQVSPLLKLLKKKSLSSIMITKKKDIILKKNILIVPQTKWLLGFLTNISFYKKFIFYKKDLSHSFNRKIYQFRNIILEFKHYSDFGIITNYKYQKHIYKEMKSIQTPIILVFSLKTKTPCQLDFRNILYPIIQK
jgi:hypothetical protein